MTVRLVSSVEIVRIAKTAGFDAIYIDLEHSAFSIETTCQISVMALEAGVPALVRVPARALESAAGLAAIEDIVGVEGVDMVLIGTNDFLADLGRPGEYDHPKCVRPTSAPSPHAASTVSMRASAA
jgi:2-keto-3-deoxy-L-rhamnonate aldolase RhmA